MMQSFIANSSSIHGWFSWLVGCLKLAVCDDRELGHINPTPFSATTPIRHNRPQRLQSRPTTTTARCHSLIAALILLRWADRCQLQYYYYYHRSFCCIYTLPSPSFLYLYPSAADDASNCVRLSFVIYNHVRFGYNTRLSTTGFLCHTDRKTEEKLA